MEQEKWFNIPGISEDYQFSSMLRTRSLKYGKIRILKYSNVNGYFNLNLSILGSTKRKTVYLHQLSWMVANNNTIPEGYEIDHIDGNRNNNNPSNLRIITHVENNQAAMKRKRNKCNMSSKYFNVVRTKNGKYSVRLYIEGKIRYIGCYKEEEMARCVAELARAGILPTSVRAKIEAEKNKINNA